MKKFFLLLTIFLIGMGLTFAALHNKNHREIQATVLKEPRPLPKMDFTVTNGENLDKYLNNKWSILFFGFTSCHSICPTTLNTLAQVKNLPQVIMISVDPTHDNLKRLKAYVKGFNKSFEGARGEPKFTEQIAKKLGVAVAKVKLNKDFTIEHSGTLLLINPKKEIAAFFTSPHSAKNISEDLEEIIKS